MMAIFMCPKQFLKYALKNIDEMLYHIMSEVYEYWIVYMGNKMFLRQVCYVLWLWWPTL